MAKEKLNITESEEGDYNTDIDIEKILSRFIDYWYGFVVGIVIMVLLACIFIANSQPKYKVNATLMVDDGQKSGLSGLMGSADNSGSAGFSFGNLLNVKSNTDNELLILSTRDLMKKVVRDLSLNITYYESGFWGNKELFKEAPFTIVLPVNQDFIKPAYFDVHFINPTEVILKPHIKDADNKLIRIKVGDIVHTEAGTFSFLPPTNQSASFDTKKDYGFTILPLKSTVSAYQDRMDISLASKQASGIYLKLITKVPAKGELILNTFIREYIGTNLNQKNQFADSTLAFIDQRLEVVNKDLFNAESQITNYKQQNEIADLGAQSQAVISNASDYEKAANDLSVRSEIINTMLRYVEDEHNNTRPVPALLSSSDPTFLALLENYNTLLTQRARFSYNNAATNPGIQNLDNQIALARRDLIHNLHNIQSAINISRKTADVQKGLVGNYIRKAPVKERQLLDLSRQQAIKQSLYLYLLQRREEMQLSKSSNIPGSRVIDTPEAENSPYFPPTKIVFAIAVLFGIAIPYGLLLTKEMLNRKVSESAELESLPSATVLGSFSHVSKPGPIQFSRDTRSRIAEQFRTFRTNVQFTLGNNEGEAKVVLFTSSMSGEGKSFIALNLARAYATLGKKVIMLDLDLRKPQLANNMHVQTGAKGISNYLVSNMKIGDILTSTDLPTLDIIISGPIPPNPTELLQNGKLNKLVQDLKLHYDIIILDTAPFGLVSDAMALIPYANSVIYVTRANYTLKKQLKIIDLLKEKLKGIPLYTVLNDVKEKASEKYGYGYGYGYGEREKRGINWRFWKK